MVNVGDEQARKNLLRKLKDLKGNLTAEEKEAFGAMIKLASESAKEITAQEAAIARAPKGAVDPIKKPISVHAAQLSSDILEGLVRDDS